MSKYIRITIFDYIKYNAVRFLKSTMYKQRMWEMYVEPNQIFVYTNVQMYKDLILIYSIL